MAALPYCSIGAYKRWTGYMKVFLLYITLNDRFSIPTKRAYEP
jgi:hypothetical protein